MDRVPTFRMTKGCLHICEPWKSPDSRPYVVPCRRVSYEGISEEQCVYRSVIVEEEAENYVRCPSIVRS